MNAPAKTAGTPAHLAVNQAWLDQYAEQPLEPLLPIIDPHHHLWDAPRPRYLLDELLADFRTGHNIVSSVFVECRAMYRTTGDEALKSLGETKFVDGIAAMSESGAYGATRVCEGIVGYVDLRLGDRAKGVLEKHLTLSDGRLRGIRNIVAWHQNPEVRSTSVPYPRDLLEDVEFRAGFAALGQLDLAYDCWLYQNQLADLTAGSRIDRRLGAGPRQICQGVSEDNDRRRSSRWAARRRSLCGTASGGLCRLAQGYSAARRIAQYRREGRRPRNADQRIWFSRTQDAADFGGSRQRVAGLYS